MLWHFFKKVNARIQVVEQSPKGKISALFHQPEPEDPEDGPTLKYNIASGARCAMNEGPWCRLMGGHVPVFSLFTFFPDHQ